MIHSSSAEATIDRASDSKQKRKRIIPISLVPWVFLAPALVLFAIYVLYPIINSFNLSLYQWDGMGEKVWVGFENYIELFDSETFYTALTNNLLWLVMFMLAPPIGLAIALFLNQEVKGIRLIKALFFFPFVISQVIVGLVFTWFYDPSLGLLNSILAFFGAEPIALLSSDQYVTYGIIAAGLWPQIAYCMILYLTGLNNLNPELIEAARLDNAKGFKLLRHIIYPNYPQQPSSLCSHGDRCPALI